tara:strand:- start:1812 stop:2180 length:369 start_codon:yes stop_codon:yes gene_type:complete
MATLSVSLTLTSAAGQASSDELKFTVTDSLSVGAPSKGVSRLSLVGDAAATAILENNATTTYVYLKNMDGTNHIKYFNDTDDGFGILWPGEFAFFAVIDAEGLKVQANNAACILEYAYWTKS